MTVKKEEMIMKTSDAMCFLVLVSGTFSAFLLFSRLICAILKSSSK